MTLQAPLFSIVTPTFNQGRYIEHTIKSLLLQTFTDYEHIIVDGGSTDETLDVLRRYEGTYRMTWTSRPDGGMYDALNSGFSRASGRIHAYLNSDDLYFPWTLQAVSERMETDRAVDVLYGDTINVDETTGAEHMRLSPPFDLVRLQCVWSLVQPAAFWKAAVTSEMHGFDATLKYVGDWDFFIRASQQFTFHKADEFLAVERRHGSSKTIGEEDPMAEENAAMLAGHQPSVSPARLLTLRARAGVARRLTWARFLREAVRSQHREGDPWRQLLDSDGVAFDVGRLASGFIPGVPYRWKAGAIRTGRDWLRPDL